MNSRREKRGENMRDGKKERKERRERVVLLYVFSLKKDKSWEIKGYLY